VVCPSFSVKFAVRSCRLSVVGAFWVLALVFHTAPTRGQEESKPVVLATVGDETIDSHDVDRMSRRVAGSREIDPAALPVLRAQVLSEVIDRHLVLAYARRTGSGPTSEDVDAGITRFKARIAAQGKSVDQVLSEQGMTQSDLCRHVTWELIWQKYRKRYVNQERLESYFDEHRREFDGTELSVRHILLRAEPVADGAALAEAIQTATRIRQAVVSGETTFEQAARSHSTAPTAKDGGSLGFIHRRGSMVEGFSQAAFALEVGQVSQPVTTAFGVHLIRVDAIKPGNKTLAEVRDRIEEALERELLERLARHERKRTPVRFTGEGPYFKPGTRELVLPGEPKDE
jgi:parvulin-like peptidyl-prolyl isomerase